jgi:RsiW-degrading membrane proteinase PrsW (M82 family)
MPRGTKRPRWLTFYMRIWLCLTIPMAVLFFLAAAAAESKFYVITLAAFGGAFVTFFYVGVTYRYLVKPRLRPLLPPQGDG